MPILEFHLDERSAFERQFLLAKNARLPDLEIQVLDESVAVSLTGATATFSMDDESGTNKVNGVAAIVSVPADGKVKYEWAALDVDTEGVFFGQFDIVVSGKSFKVPNNRTQRLRIIVGPRVN